jgi:nucleotide-binding universal stress UspA family protein
MMKLGNIVVATDLSPIAKNACEVGLAIARAARARLTLVYVIPPQVVVHAGLPIGIRSEVEGLDRKAREADRRRLEALAAKARRGGVRASAVMQEGDPVAELLRIARNARPDLLVIGTHGRGGAAHLLLGSVAEKVVRSAPCAVLAVKKGKLRRRGPVLIALDDSGMAPRVAAAGAAIARALRARPLVVHALPGAEIPPDYLLPSIGADMMRRLTAIGRSRALDQVRGTLRAAKVRVAPKDVLVADGRPQDVIVSAAAKHRPAVTVVGIHGRTGLSRILLGSVAESVVRRAPSPVLVVRPKGAGRG